MDSGLAGKLLIFTVIIIGLVISVFAGTWISEENYFLLLLTLFGLGGIVYTLFSGLNYWIIVPFTISSGLPAIPLGGRQLEIGEFATAGSIGLFIFYLALKRQQMRIFNIVSLPVLAFILWVAMVYVIYPTGLALFGSQAMGGRFYLKLLLAFGAFIVCSGAVIHPKNIRVLLFALLAAYILYATYSIFAVFKGWAGEGALDSFYSWHQSLAVPSTALVTMLFAYKKPSEVFSFRGLPYALIFLFALIVTVYSGKRMAVFGLLLIPFVALLLSKEYKQIIIAGCCFVILLAFGMSSPDVVQKLPLNMQRGLSWIGFLEFDKRIEPMKGGTDEWRAALRQLAWERFLEDPIIGKGYVMDYSKSMSAVYASETIWGRGTGTMETAVAGYAIGQSWHNRWIGYMADFGLPLLIFQIGIWFAMLYAIAFILSNKNAAFEFQVFARYTLFIILRDLISSHTSGHTALDAYSKWWMYGVIVAIYLSIRQNQRQSNFSPSAEQKSEARIALARV